MANSVDFSSRALAFAGSGLILAADQASKWAVQLWLQYGQPLELAAFFDLRLAWNSGAAFSIFNDGYSWQRWLLVLLPVAISIWLATVICRGHQRLERYAMAAVLGGALGNLADRLRLGYVVDFISLHWRGWYWPTFNLADAAICAGVALLLVAYVRGGGGA